MKVLAVTSQIFLLVVGVLYVVLGLASLLSGSGIFFRLGIFVQPPMLMYTGALTKALCNFVPSCEDLKHLTPIIFAIIIGILGAVGAIKIMRRKEIGYQIWKFLIIVLGITLLFNFVADISDVFDRYPTDDFIIIHIISLLWLVAIWIVYFVSLKYFSRNMLVV